MRCDNCGKEGAQVRLTTKSYGRGEDLLIIEDVPIIQCPHCHETYMTAETVHKLDDIRQNRQSWVARPVKVAHLTPAEAV